VISRRAFAVSLGRTALAVALVGCGPKRGRPRAAEQKDRAVTIDRIGIQLYTVRDLMAREPDATLRALAAIGYREVEFAGLHGRSAREIRRILNDHGLTAPAGHVSIQEIRTSFPRLLDDAAMLGWRWIVCPWIDEPERTTTGYKRLAADLNRAGESARAAGIRLAYHNQSYEFAPIAGGVIPYDLLLAELDSEAVDMELDVFWMVHAGADPLAYLSRHPDRFRLVHVKDRTLAGEMVDVGRGAIDFPRILAAAATAGVRHYFVEHDRASSPLDFARHSFAYLRRLRF
jgi:sugar phosphate isomerase/epimerase